MTESNTFKGKYSIDKILERVNSCENGSKFWVMGERFWSMDLYNSVQTGKYEKTGVFFSKQPSKEINFYSDCYKLYFFNSDMQIFCVRKNSNSNFNVVESHIKAEKSKEYFSHNTQDVKKGDAIHRYPFAVKTCSIPKELCEKNILVIKESSGDWRFYHE
ncbi:hypothetical protein JXR93_09555 [bacterium]|nr:hypothetical protein [bacterium]